VSTADGPSISATLRCPSPPTCSRNSRTAAGSSLDGVAALAGPTVGYTAPEQDPPFGTDADHGEGRFTGPYNLSGHPAVSLPVPTAGLPAGLQLAGRRGGDGALLQVAAAADRLLAGGTPLAGCDMDDRQKEI
jgi:Asp-tRNA(Asn)/Glu-tRNA(Gln) amidotransferase A subunit family amidase